MNGPLFYAAAGIVLFFIGAHALFAGSHLLRTILAANIMGSGVFMVFIALAARPLGPPDPVPHAMVLTGIVVTVAFTAVAAALAVAITRSSGETTLREDPNDEP